MFDLIIADGTVVTSTGRYPADVAVREGRIAALLSPGEGRAFTARLVDARGLFVLPGAIDVHVHFRDPGLTHKEDFLSGTAAAACGGVTTVLDMPNTLPPVTNPAALAEKIAALEGRAYVDYGLYAAMTPESLPHLEALADGGALAFKVFAGPTTGGLRAPEWGELIEPFRRLARRNRPVVVHAEDRAAIDGARTGPATSGGDGAPGNAYAAFLASRPRAGEVLATASALVLAAQTGVRLHIAHVALREAVPLLAWAKAEGAPVSAETCPQYLFADRMVCAGLGSLAKVLPPIRDPEDREALWQGLQDGIIDVMATDHAPHAAEEKEGRPFSEAAAGVIGVETMLPLLLDAAAAGQARLEQIVAWTSERPAVLFGLGPAKGAIQVGADADLALVDLAAPWRIERAFLHSRGKNTLFDGRSGRGRVVATFLRGEPVVSDGRLREHPAGRFITPGA